MKKIYISGKISGMKEEEAYELFEIAENEVNSRGYKAVNPMKLTHNHDKSWASYMKEDIKALCSCDAIYMLPNWQESKGATIELTIAMELQIAVIYKIPDSVAV